MLDFIEQAPLSARMVLRRTESTLELRHVVADRLPIEALPTEVHDYGGVLFISTQVTPEVLRSWFELRAGVAADISFTVPTIQNQVDRQRQPGYAGWDPVSLPWPVTRFEIHQQAGDPPVQFWGALIAQDESSSFPDYETAALHYLYDFSPSRNPRGFPPTFGVVRVADLRAWLQEVRLGLTAVTVRIGGTLANRARVEITAPPVFVRRVVGKFGRARLPLPAGLPSRSMLMVSVHGVLTDYRWIGGPSTSPEESGITVERPEPSSSLRALILQGEGLRTEFKVQIPEGKRNDQKLPFLKTVAAFASGLGGTIIFGVGEHGRRNEGEIVGIDSTGVRDRLTNMLRDSIEPFPRHEFLTADIDGKEVVAVIVEGDRQVHGVFPDNPQYFIRRGSTTFPAKVSELKEMLKSEITPGPISRPGWQQ